MKLSERIYSYKQWLYGHLETLLVGHQVPNCMGFAFWKLGLAQTEGYIDTGNLQNLLRYFDEVEILEVAEAIVGIETNNNEKVIHIAVIDPDDRNFLLSRPGYAKPVERLPVGMVISQFDPATKFTHDGAIKVLFLKVKPEKNRVY